MTKKFQSSRSKVASVFSSRTNWQRHPNRLSQVLERRRREGAPIYDLTISNPTDAGFTYPSAEILGALARGVGVPYAPDPLGLKPAREAIAAYYAGKNISVSPDHIVLTASTSEAYGWLFMLLCDAGDNVLAPVPSYPLFEYLARLHDVELRTYHLRYDGAWHIDFDSLAQSVTSRTRACILVSPHNPTGAVLRRDELAWLSRFAQAHNIALIADEVFTDYRLVEDSRQVTSTAGNEGALTCTLNGISKLCGLPQWKLGWIVVSGPDAQRQEALRRLEFIADTFLSVNTPVQVALPELLRLGVSVRDEIQHRVRENYHFLKMAIPVGSSASILTTEGGWYAVLRVPRTLSDEDRAIALLDNFGVYLFPGYFFDFDESGFLVISLLAEPAILQSGVEAIRRAL